VTQPRRLGLSDLRVLRPCSSVGVSMLNLVQNGTLAIRLSRLAQDCPVGHAAKLPAKQLFCTLIKNAEISSVVTPGNAHAHRAPKSDYVSLEGLVVEVEEGISVHADRQLVEQAREGCQEAFGELINRHYQTYVNIAGFILRDYDEAQDEVQKACYKAFSHLDQYQGEAEFSTWMLRIVVNQCLMLLRVRKRVQFLRIDAGNERDRSRPIELYSSEAGPEKEVIDSELKGVLRREIRRIPSLLRNVLVLRDVQELPMTDVAERLKITVPAAKSRLLRARFELKERMMHHCGSEWHQRPATQEQG
jgi:RNA polymerase sigma-70 factor, ECF subfamily